MHTHTHTHTHTQMSAMINNAAKSMLFVWINISDIHPVQEDQCCRCMYAVHIDLSYRDRYAVHVDQHYKDNIMWVVHEDQHSTQCVVHID